VRRAAQAFSSRYGASPLHLLGALASFAVIVLAAAGWFEEPTASLKYILIWFAGAVLAHDMLLLPFYAGVDRVGSLLRCHPRGVAEGAQARVRTPGWVYLRIPLLLSGLVLLVFGPEILRKGDAAFRAASGQQQHVYLGRYLILVSVLFGVSATAYAVARLRARSAPGGSVDRRS